MREASAYILVGNEVTGKSTMAVKLLQRIGKGNVLIYKDALNIDDKAFAAYPLRSFYSYAGGKAKISDGEIAWKPFCRMVTERFKNGVLLVDDAANYERNDSSEEYARLLRMRRHIGVDIIMIYHAIRELPIRALDRCDRLLLFETSDKFEHKASQLLSFAALKVAQERINYEAKTNRHACAVVKLRR